MSETRVITIHGTGGSPEANWFPWLKSKLNENGCKCLIPKFPTLEDQNLENWLCRFDETVGELKPDDILIGHSIGAVFVLHLLNQSKVTVKQSILVCPFNKTLGLPDFDYYNSTFVNYDFNWQKIKAKSKIFTLFAGSDDPYVPIELSEEISHSLDQPLIVIENGGHLNQGSGFLEFDDLMSSMLL